MRPQWFFRDYEDWDWRDRELLPLVDKGPVLDLGAGAGRAFLFLQRREEPSFSVFPSAFHASRRTQYHVL